MRMLALALLLVLAVPATAGSVALSEVLPDPDGKDDGNVFVELYGTPDLSLDGWSLLGRNGNGGGVTHEVSLTGLSLGSDGYLVVADGSSGVTDVADADLIVDDFDLQNGPDSVELVSDGQVVDALAYGTFSSDLVSFGEGDPAVSPRSGMSLTRRFADVDTGDNLADFVLASPTPGRGRLVSEAVPEPDAVLLLGLGLLGLAAAARRYSKATSRP